GIGEGVWKIVDDVPAGLRRAGDRTGRAVGDFERRNRPRRDGNRRRDRRRRSRSREDGDLVVLTERKRRRQQQQRRDEQPQPPITARLPHASTTPQRERNLPVESIGRWEGLLEMRSGKRIFRSSPAQSSCSWPTQV